MDEDVATSYPVNLSIELKLFWDQIVGQHSKYEDVQKFIKIKLIIALSKYHNLLYCC